MATKSALDILASTAINDRCNELTKQVKQLTHENEANKKRLIDKSKEYNKMEHKLEDVTKQKDEYKELWESSYTACNLQHAIIGKGITMETEYNDKINALETKFQNELKCVKQKYEAQHKKIIQKLSKCKQENKSLKDSLWETEHTNKALVDEVEELRERLDKSGVRFESIDI